MSTSFFGCDVSDGIPDGGMLGDFGSYTGINDKIADFTLGPGLDVFRASSGYGNGKMFDCDWTNNNAVYDSEAQALNFKITNDGNKIYGAEYQSREKYGYGYFSARFKAIKRSGVVTSFFTYTGYPRWDEIDIEVLGKDTTKVQFNYYTNGEGGHEYLYDLGFDASEGFHEYGFKWEEDKIIWYVDGKGVYCATADIPVSQTQIMFNVWNGKSSGTHDISNWLGTYDKSDRTDSVAQYKWAAYRPLAVEDSAGNNGDPDDGNNNTDTTPSVDYGSYTGKNDKLADFTYGKRDDLFYASHGWTNGGMFDCYWNAGNIVYDGGTQSLKLKITDGGNSLLAGEYRTNQKYGYGYYSVYMKAVKRDGVVTSMFTYTGGSDGTEWHEIDIEILGNDTTKVQFNYFTNGVGGHEKLYDLGFDASEGFHEYGFKWEEGKITWYVDGKGVYTAETDTPYIPGRIMINAWPGKSEGDDSVVNWSGRFERTFPVPDAEYKWIGYKSL